MGRKNGGYSPYQDRQKKEQIFSPVEPVDVPTGPAPGQYVLPQVSVRGNLGLFTPSNPYAFVPFGASGPDRTDIAETYAKAQELLTGWIDVSLFVKTKLIIPDALKAPESKEVHRSYSFFRDPTGQLMIPGSELRGLLRSVYETASDSCVPFLLNNDDRISMRLPLYTSLRNRGLLELKDGQWKLWSAQDYRCPVNNDELREIKNKGTYLNHKPGGFYYFTANGVMARKADKNSPGALTGWLQFSAPIAQRIDAEPKSKNHYSVHYLTKKSILHTWEAGDNSPFDIMKEMLDHDGDSQRRTTRDAASSVHKMLLQRLRDIREKKAGTMPVWYLKVDAPEKERYILSPSSIGRINQLRNWTDIMSVYGPCRCGERSCPACQLFGQVKDTNGGKEQGWAARGRIRVGDATPDGPVKTGFSTLPILNGPKPTAFEMYIRRPENAAFWNYDIQAVKKGMRTEFSAREDFTPRGRKYYWHGEPRTCREMDKNSKLTSTMEWAGEGAGFRFRVHFDRITAKQLRQLIWVITLGDNRPDSKLCHKLGHGKPVGYGSVKLTADRLALRRVSCEGGSLRWSLASKALPQGIACPFPRKNEIQLQSLLAISTMGAVNNAWTDYPRPQGGGDIFKWFADNHKNANYVKTLPEILQTVTAMPVKYETEESARELISI